MAEPFSLKYLNNIINYKNGKSKSSTKNDVISS